MQEENKKPIKKKKPVEITRDLLKAQGLTLVKTEDLKSSLIAKSQKTDVFNPVVWNQFNGMAKTMIESNAMPDHIKTPAQAMVVMQAGYEMGMKPMESINSLYIVSGVTTIWGKAITQQFRKHGYKLNFKDEENKTTVTAIHKNGDTYTETFTFDEAEKSGYTKSNYGKLKFGWKEGANRNIKLRYNAMNKLAKTQCAEVLGTTSGIAEVYQDAINITDAEVVEEVSQDDTQKIKNVKTISELTKLFNKMLKIYKPRQIKDLFSTQRTVIEQEAE